MKKSVERSRFVFWRTIICPTSRFEWRDRDWMMLQSGHSSATWCIMVIPLCGVYLLMFIKSGVLDFTIVMIYKKSYISTAKAPHFAT